MKKFLTLCFILFALPSWGETVSMDEIVRKGDLFYKHSSNVPYTGLATDYSVFFEIGYFKDGKREGVWTSYWFNDKGVPKLASKVSFKDNQIDGQLIDYLHNEEIDAVRSYKNGTPHGIWQNYYAGNNQVAYSGHYKEGKKYGTWIVYNEDGSLDNLEHYIDGVLIIRTYSLFWKIAGVVGRIIV